MKYLIDIGWACRIEADVRSATPPPSKEFYLLDIGATHSSVDPLELLQAYKPDGVICYLSALSYHSLTTQLAAYHHIAVLIKPPEIRKSCQIRPNDKTKDTDTRMKKKSLGEMVFTYQGIPCYLTKRLPSVLVGVRTRILGPRTHLRIATLEQTLIDTLHKPLCCGGASVVFEAWEEGITRLDEELLTDYLNRIRSHLISRRVGAMFDLLGYVPSGELEEILEKVSESGSQLTPATNISLLPGIEFSSPNPKWRVMTP